MPFKICLMRLYDIVIDENFLNIFIFIDLVDELSEDFILFHEFFIKFVDFIINNHAECGISQNN